MDLENIMLSEISQSEKAENHMISCICGYKTETQAQAANNRVVTTTGREGWEGVVKDKAGQLHGTEGDLTSGGRHTMQYTDHVPWKCTPAR